MAKQPDYTGTLINIGIFAGVVIVAVLLFKWLKGELGSGSFSLAGLFGKGGFPTDDGGPTMTTAGVVNPGADPSLPDLSLKSSKGGGTVVHKMEVSHKASMASGKLQTIAYELEAANAQARRYEKASGSNAIINKAIARLNALADHEFIQAINLWQKLDGFHTVYDTHLWGAKIYTGAHSKMLTRYTQILGNPSNKSPLNLAGL